MIQPSFSERRGDHFLLIWPDLPFWMVVDEEVKEVIECFEKDTEPPLALNSLRERSPQLNEGKFQKLLHHLGENYLIAGSGAPSSNDEELIENVTINITNRCNLRCKTCYNQPLEHGEDELEPEDIRRFLGIFEDRIKNGGTFAVLGGEPLIRPEETLEVCKIAKEFGLKPIVSTNGTLINDDLAKRMRKIGLELQISLDGATAQTNDLIRGKGTFDIVKENMKIVTRRKVYTILSMVVCNENIPELSDFLELSKKWRTNEVRFIPMKRIGHGKDGELTPPDPFRLIEETARVLKDDRRLRRKLLRDFFSILAYQCTICIPRHNCGVGYKTVFIDGDGSLYPCPNFCYGRFRFGDIRMPSHQLLKAWDEGSEMREIREGYDVDSHPLCSGCYIKHWCGGGCRGESFSVHGDLGFPSVTCSQTKGVVKEMMWTLSELPDLKRTWAKEEHF